MQFQYDVLIKKPFQFTENEAIQPNKYSVAGIAGTSGSYMRCHPHIAGLHEDMRNLTCLAKGKKES